MTAKEYVVCQLDGYTQFRNDITTLEFELKSLAPFDELQTDDLIETLTFSHPTESPVQESRISDKQLPCLITRLDSSRPEIPDFASPHN